jgi:hypothetical protein
MIDLEISQSEKLQSFLKKGNFFLIEDDHTVTLFHKEDGKDIFVHLFGPGATAQAIYQAAAEYQGQKINGER